MLSHPTTQGCSGEVSSGKVMPPGINKPIPGWAVTGTEGCVHSDRTATTYNFCDHWKIRSPHSNPLEVEGRQFWSQMDVAEDRSVRTSAREPHLLASALGTSWSKSGEPKRGGGSRPSLLREEAQRLHSKPPRRPGKNSGLVYSHRKSCPTVS